MTAKAKPSPTFRTFLKAVANEEVVVPILRNALWSPEFKSFNVKVEGFKERPPDGWFHPSTHPLWTEPHLYYYMKHPELVVREPFDPQSTIAVTAGSFFHTFTQVVLVQAGALVKQPEVCDCGHKHPERAEVYLRDEEVKSRGHSDGVLAIMDDAGFEFKTMNPNKLGKIPQGDPDDLAVLEWFKKACPDYYAQAQEYLRIGKRKKMVVVIMSLTYPFPMREIHVPYVHTDAMKVRDKFARVIQAIADGRPPQCECGPTKKSCPVWSLCWEEWSG